MNAAPKHIVFDWNSTLLDDSQAVLASTNRLLQAEGLAPMTIETFRAHYTVPLEAMYRNIGFNAAQVEHIMDAESSTFHDYYEPLALMAGLREGADDILAHAKNHGVRNLILSNHLVEPIRTQLRRLNIEHHFAEVLAYADRATQFRDMTKGERLRRFLKSEDIKTDTTMIVGDSIEEIEIAREQGLISVAITGGCVSEERLSEQKSDYLIHSLHELKAIMQERGFTS